MIWRRYLRFNDAWYVPEGPDIPFHEDSQILQLCLIGICHVGADVDGVEEQPSSDPDAEPVGIVKTLEGDMIARPGDWIITGVEGEKYPCKDEIFQKTYEPAS